MPKQFDTTSDDTVPLAELLAAAADDIEVLPPGEAHPTRGRVIEDPADGTVYIGDGASWLDVDSASGLDTGSVSAGSINNERHVFGDDSRSDIESELTESGTVVINGDHSSLSDEIAIGSDGVTVVIAEGATVGFADDATPTKRTDGQGQGWSGVFYNPGYDDLSLVVRGEINANASTLSTDGDHTHGGLFCEPCSGFYAVCERGGRFKDCWPGIWMYDSTDFDIPFLRGEEMQTSVFGGEGLDYGEIGTLYNDATGVSEGHEAIDLNAYCSDISIDRAIGKAVSESVIDINESGDLDIGSVTALGQSCNSAVNITSQSGARWTAKPARGDSNNVTIRAVSGYTQHRAINCAGGNPIQNLTITNINVEVEPDVNKGAVVLSQETDGQYDGLTLRGRAKCDSADFPALRQGYVDGSITGTSANATIEMEVVGQRGASLNGLTDSDIRINAHDCIFRPFDIAPDVTDCDIHAIVNDNTGSLGIRVRASDCTLTGKARGNSGDDILVTSDASNMRLDIDYGTITNNGTNTTEASYSAL